MWHRLTLLAVLGLSGCGSVLAEATSTVAGVAGAATGAAITKDATLAAAVGLGVDSAAREGLRYVARRVHRFEQERIAESAGRLTLNQIGSWSVEHDIPIEDDERGQVVVSREFGAMDFRCKEIVFSVDTTHKQVVERAFYTATICSDGKAWRWATAEPTTRRWAGLQ